MSTISTTQIKIPLICLIKVKKPAVNEANELCCAYDYDAFLEELEKRLHRKISSEEKFIVRVRFTENHRHIGAGWPTDWSEEEVNENSAWVGAWMDFGVLPEEPGKLLMKFKEWPTTQADPCEVTRMTVLFGKPAEKLSWMDLVLPKYFDRGPENAIRDNERKINLLLSQLDNE